jgi:hypothetical protein
MPRAPLARYAGIALFVVAILLPCVPFMDVGGYSMPYQDPTPDMLKQQAADVAAAEHRLAVAITISGVLGVCGLIALIYARRQDRSRKASNQGPDQVIS